MNGKTKEIVLYNTMGQNLLKGIFTTPQYEMDLSRFANGLYMVKIQAENGGQQILKVIKK